MVAFRVVKERHGWAIRMDDRMIAPFWSKAVAVREANSLAVAIRRHGEHAEVTVEAGDATLVAVAGAALTSGRGEALVGRLTPD
jgi:hypothetical protein